MSSMTDQDFQDTLQTNQHIDTTKLPLSPSATSTASSSSSSYNSSSNAAAQAAAAAIALLAEQRHTNGNNNLTQKDFAKMNLDHFNTIANVASQLQHHLNKQQAQLNYNEENLLALSKNQPKIGHKSRRPLPPPPPQQQQQSLPIHTNESSMQDDDDDCDRNSDFNEDDDNELDEHTLNLCLKQRKRNGDLIKGNSMSPSPRETICSDEPHSAQSPLKSPLSHKHSHSSHSEEHDRSLTPNSSRSISPKSSSYTTDNNNTTLTGSSYDPSMLSQLQNGMFPGGLAAAAAFLPNGQSDPLSNLSAAMTANAAANLPITSTVATILASRKRRNERDSNERNKKIKPVPDEKKDDQYWERRRKNNEAAKRSRDLRRQKEDDIAVRAAFLEQENLKLRAQVTILKAELSKLHFMIYNR